MEKVPKIGDVVLYVTPKGPSVNAPVTTVWSPVMINVVFVTPDVEQRDDYGRQTKRESSVGHKSMPGVVHGRYWRWSDEEAVPHAGPLE